MRKRAKSYTTILVTSHSEVTNIQLELSHCGDNIGGDLLIKHYSNDTSIPEQKITIDSQRECSSCTEIQRKSP